MQSDNGPVVCRRRVLHGQTALGESSLPLPQDDSDGQANPSDVQKTACLAGAPQRAMLEANRFYLVWTEHVDGAERVTVWAPESAEEEAEAERFYRAAHGGQPPTIREAQRPNWLRSIAGWFASPAPSEEEKALIRQVLNAPALNSPRLAYAQRLMERGDPQGEFILADIAIEALPIHDRRRPPINGRWSDLHEEYGPRWLKPLGRLGLRPGFAGHLLPAMWIKRGLIARVEVTKPGILPEKADRLFAAAPLVYDLRLKYSGVDIMGIAAIPQMRQITRLELESIHTTPDDLETILSAPNFGGVTDFSIASIELNADRVAAIANSPGLARIRSLGVGILRLRDAGAIALAQSKHWGALEELEINFNHIGSAGFQALTVSRGLAQLKRLDISSNQPEAEGVAAFANAPFLKTLQELNLEDNNLSADLLAQLANANMPELRRVTLNDNQFGDEGADFLGRSPWVGQLRVLGMARVGLGPRGAKFLAEEFHGSHLQELDLSHNPLGDAGATALAGSSLLNNALKLRLNDSGIGAAGVEALSRSPAAGRLSELELRDNPLDDAAARALARSPHLGRLRNLYVSSAAISEAGRNELVSRFTDDVVSIW